MRRIQFIISAALLVLSGCGTHPESAARRPAVHPSCLHACRNVTPVPPCRAGSSAEPAETPASIEAQAVTLSGRRVRVLGRVAKKRQGPWTAIDCPAGVCCSEQLNAGLELTDTRRPSALDLVGHAVLPGNQVLSLKCYSRAGKMTTSYMRKPAAPFTFEATGKALQGQQLEQAYCCSINADQRLALVVATVRVSDSHAGRRVVLEDPEICLLSN